MKMQEMKPVRGSRTVPTAKLVKGSRMRGRSRSRLPYGPWSILDKHNKKARETSDSFNLSSGDNIVVGDNICCQLVFNNHSMTHADQDPLWSDSCETGAFLCYVLFTMYIWTYVFVFVSYALFSSVNLQFCNKVSLKKGTFTSICWPSVAMVKSSRFKVQGGIYCHFSHIHSETRQCSLLL